MTRTSRADPRRGEVWLLDLDPGRGAEQRKVRPVVVLSEDGLGRLPLRIVAPLTSRRPQHAAHPWMVPVKASRGNGLTRDSLADGFQVRAVSLERFRQRLGRLAARQTDDLAAAVALCVGAP